MTGLPTVKIENGMLIIDGRLVPTTGWTMKAEPSDSFATLSAELPVFDISDPDPAGVRLLYVASLSPLVDLVRTGDTPQAALRALADAIDEVES